MQSVLYHKYCIRIRDQKVFSIQEKVLSLNFLHMTLYMYNIVNPCVSRVIN